MERGGRAGCDEKDNALSAHTLLIIPLFKASWSMEAGTIPWLLYLHREQPEHHELRLVRRVWRVLDHGAVAERRVH